jgi:aminopeptidase N
VTTTFGPKRAAATLAGDPSVAARIRASRELAKDATAPSRAALAAAFANEPFWGVLAEAAGALGKTRAPWANAILLDALRHANPKVRRAAAAALGNFRNAETASALLPSAQDESSYFVRAAALGALGRTRDARAFDVLTAALGKRTWNGTVEAGAVRGLAELADVRATDAILGACEIGRDEGLRRAAMGALGRQGELLESERTRVVGALDRYADDPMFLVSLAAIAAIEGLGDARHLGTLGRLGDAASDGRVRRDAQEAAIRIREARTVPAQVSGLRDDVDALRDAHRKLQEKIEALGRA